MKKLVFAAASVFVLAGASFAQKPAELDDSSIDVAPPIAAPALDFSVDPVKAGSSQELMVIVADETVELTIHGGSPSLVAAGFFVQIYDPASPFDLDLGDSALLFAGLLTNGQLSEKIKVPLWLVGMTIAGYALATDGVGIEVSQVRYALVE